MKKCETCERKARTGERFCNTHRGKLLKEMDKNGYLTPVPETNWNETALPNPAEVQAVRVW